MAFWGIEVKPDTPFVFRSDDEGGRLHVSQATLGNGSSSKKSILQCKVGDKKPIYLCSLLPKRLETCQLNLEFEEDEEVTFSIIGAHSVHISGFFYGDDEAEDDHGHDCGSDYSDEGMMESDSEYEDDSEDDGDDYSDSDGLEMYPPSPVHNSGVRIEEIVDEVKAKNENDSSKRTKRKKTDENSNLQIVTKAGTGGDSIIESEDEDGFPIIANQKKTDTSKAQTKLGETNGEKSQKKSDKGDKLKRKIDTVDQTEKPARESIEQGGSELQNATIVPENNEEGKKNKKLKVAETVETGSPNSNVTAKTGNDLNLSSEKKKKKKEKKKKNKQPESGPSPNSEEKSTNGLVLEKQEKKEAKPSQVRTYPNGLVIEEMVMGKPDGKRASRGKKVRVHYIGKLQKNGKIFDSNIGKAPFEFRLGIGKVIKGWDVGVEGMRVGDKRRLTIPPVMGYGATGARPVIPPNAWLTFDVELVDVNSSKSDDDTTKLNNSTVEERVLSVSIDVVAIEGEDNKETVIEEEDELRKRAEEFLEKINRGWRDEKMRT